MRRDDYIQAHNPGVVECIVSSRYLQFSPESDLYNGEEILTLDVMFNNCGDKDRVLCQLLVSKERLLKAIGDVKLRKKEAAQ